MFKYKCNGCYKEHRTTYAASNCCRGAPPYSVVHYIENDYNSAFYDMEELN